MKKFLSYTLIVLISFATGLLNAQDEARLLRFPAIYENQIVFSQAGDLYVVGTNGGMARKLTSHIGYEMFPKFSPDGKHIAFTGQYDGNTEVFVIPSKGGVPRRLSYTATLDRDDVSDRMGPNNIVMGWTPDGKYIIYRSRKASFNAFKGSLYKVPVEGGISEQLPLSFGGFCSYSPDGNKLAFNWVFREFRTWKYYQGGMADDIRIYHFKTGEVEKITDTENQEIFPMWIDDNIYFLSDRDRTMNLFVYNENTKTTQKLTDFTEYDIKFPSAGKKDIVFENAGYIYKYDISSGKAEKVNITIADDQLYARTDLKEVSKDIRSGDLSPNGERVVFAARGEIFSLPAKEGVTYNLTQSPGVHERNVEWSPDGQYIAFVSDKTGEFEIYIQKQDGTEPAKQITKNSKSYIFGFIWSPDGKKILYDDRQFELNYIDIETGKKTLIEKEIYGSPGSYDWSPDSKWIAYDHTIENRFSIIRLFNTETGKKYDVTDEWYHSEDPEFSPDGKYLYFTSARDFSATYSQTEWNHSYGDLRKIYLATLAKDVFSPFAAENDMVKIETDEKKEEEKAISIDPDGIKDRILSLPLKPSNYFGLNSTKDKIYYRKYSTAEGISTRVYDLSAKKETDLGKKLALGLSASGKKALVGMSGKWAIIDPPTAPVSITEAIDLSNMKTLVNYQQEWAQIFDESWRQMRDFFYMENMHGLDWPAMKEKYGVLLPYVKHRDDLTYIIGEMIGELSIGHAYINSGEKANPERIKTGLLGAEISKHASGYFQIDKIMRGANWSEDLKSPLTEIGMNIYEGDFITAVNGNSVKESSDIYSMLVGMAGKKVELSINTKASEEGTRKVLVTPIADETKLIYYNWVKKNIEYVNKKTNGEVGYIHVPDMGPGGLNEFAKYFYPQLDKKGLIIDDRGNGGGNVSPMIIERLRRDITRATMRRGLPEGTSVPRQMILGPKVLLIDRYSASDGDLFPYSFKKHDLGTVIGTRTWGGVVGITGSLPFIDGQDLRKPEFASYSSEESKWIIEGYGVDPDIYLDNDPHQEFLGKDAQLDKAIEVIKEQLKDFKGIPDVPEAPDKSGK